MFSRPKGRPKMDNRRKGEEEALLLLQSAERREKEAAAEEATFRFPQIRAGGMARLSKGDILEAAMNAARCVPSVARGSANLKGNYAKTIKDGMSVVLAAVRELEARASDPSGGKRMERLRQEIWVATNRIRRLKRELAILRVKKNGLRTGLNAICGHGNE